MSDPIRYRYRISLLDRAAPVLLEAPPLVIRHPDRADQDCLAELMLDACMGTIDYEGEGIEPARLVTRAGAPTVG